MSVWWCFFKKEFRLMQSFWVTAGVALIIAGLTATYLAYQFHSGVPSMALFIVMVWHSFYLFIYMMVSLRREKGNTPIWMQSPQPAWLLLSTKFAAGLVLMYASLVVTLAFWQIVMNLDFQTGLYQGQHQFRVLLSISDLMQAHWGMSILAISKRALCLSALGTLIYFFIDLLKYLFRGWRWVIGLLLFLAVLFVVVCFRDTAIFGALFGWGKIQLTGFSTLHLPETINGPPAPWIFKNFFPAYWGAVLYELLLFLIAFFVSAWLLDRKVEV
ncbi:MAG TPA: hypothetical protein VFK37_00325 [Bacillales bacterium]|nr:hypothetical protein [Bacillales bacterium]